MQYDFQAYIRDRKGGGDRRAASGLSYAYARDRRVMRGLNLASRHFDPIVQACTVAGTREHDDLLGAISDVCRKLQASPSDRVLVAPDDALGYAAALADHGEELLVVTPACLALEPAQRAFHLGRAIGHLQQGHALYLGAAWIMRDEPDSFLRWVVKPATAALESWSRLGDVTADRAGLLACADLDCAIGELMRACGVVGDPAEVQADGGMADLDEVLAGRIRALQAFSDAEVYRRSIGLDGGESMTAVDSRVEAVIKLV